jgi:hypothetical protein
MGLPELATNRRCSLGERSVAAVDPDVAVPGACDPLAYRAFPGDGAVRYRCGDSLAVIMRPPHNLNLPKMHCLSVHMAVSAHGPLHERLPRQSVWILTVLQANPFCIETTVNAELSIFSTTKMNKT